MKYEPDSAKGEAQRIWYNMLNTVNSNRNDCFNLEFGFKKLMHIIYTQVLVHPCTLWAKKRKYDSGKKSPDRQTVSEILFKTKIRPQ